MNKVPAAGVPAAASTAATIQPSPIVAHGSPQYNNDNFGKRTELDRALDEMHAGITELSESCSTRDRVKREVERLITRKSKSDDDDESEIDGDSEDLVRQRLADIEREIEVERIRWLAERKTVLMVMEGESGNSKDNDNGKGRS